CQIANVAYELRDLSVRKLAFVRRHFLTHAVRYAGRQLRVSLLLHVVGGQILRAQLFPHRDVPAAVGSVARRALRFKQSSRITLRPRGCGKKKKGYSNEQQRSTDTYKKICHTVSSKENRSKSIPSHSPAAQPLFRTHNETKTLPCCR